MDSVTRQPVRIGRLTGVAALAAFGVSFLDISLGAGNFLHGGASTQGAIAYAAQNTRLITLQGTVDGLDNTFLAVVIVLLIAVAGGSGILARIAYVCAGGAVAIQWVHAGILYGLSDLAHRGGADQGVMALFTLGSTMDDADAIVIPIAVACVGWMLLRSKQAPAFVAWLTLASAAFQFLLVIFNTFGGPDLGPASVVSGWLWYLAIGIALLIKPVSSAQRAGTAARATA